jgi:hypothetical protein
MRLPLLSDRSGRLAAEPA